MMRNEITNFLINEKICVGGRLDGTQISGGWAGEYTTVTVDFGHAFPRKPTVVVSLSYVYGPKLAHNALAQVQKVTKTSADVYVSTYGDSQCYVTWMACL